MSSKVELTWPRPDDTMICQVEHCTLLLKCCQAVLLFCASDPSSALQANSDYRYVTSERKEMNLVCYPSISIAI